MAHLQPISLGARRKSGSVSFDTLPAAKDVWRKDDFVCQFCGFRAEKYQRTVPGAWCDNARPALTACFYCEQCFTLDTAGMASSGFLIWLPEISQAQLHHLCRAIYIGRPNPTFAARAQTALDALMSRRADAKKRLGTDDPLVLGTALLENLSEQDYQRRTAKLSGIRFLPTDRYLVNGRNGIQDQFPAILAYWQSAQGPYSRIPVEGWFDRFLFTASP